MQTLQTKINVLLQQEDIEGYIHLGAPIDEYSPEATDITDGIARMKEDERNEQNITAFLMMIWRQRFDLSETDMTHRAQAIQKLARAIIKLK